MGTEHRVAAGTESNEQKYDHLKLLFLSLAFFCVIGAYTVTKELKNSIFYYTVGKEYIPLARWLAMFALVPGILIYSKLVDTLRRYQLLCIYSLFYAVFGLVFAYFIGHPEIGILNTNTNPNRLFGWLFYFFIEGCSPFVVSVCWAFANSINSPKSAQKNYGFMVSGSKLGGMLTAGAAWLMLRYSMFGSNSLMADLYSHQFLLIASSLLLFMVPLVIILMMRHIPGKYLHGYEAVYQVEKEKQKEGESNTGVLAGLNMLLRYPYVLGIFGMSFFYEMLATVLSYMAILEGGKSESLLGYLLEIAFMSHFVGFFISFFGTSALFSKLGTRRCLLLIPVMSGLALFYFMTSSSASRLLQVVFVFFRSINYAFSWPLRESLYIPTVKEIKFKSKSWIDAFGSKLAKSSGSAYNLILEWAGPSFFMLANSLFFSSIVGLWMITAWLLGKRFDKAVARNEVIGIDTTT